MVERISTKVTPPPPAEFAAEFVKGGWRRVERLYGARTDRLLKWIEMCGGSDLYSKRRQARATAVQRPAAKG